MYQKLSIVMIAVIVVCMPARADVSSLDGYDRYQQVTRAMRSLGADGRITRIQWSECGGHVTFMNNNDQWLRFDLSEKTLKPLDDDDDVATSPRTRRAIRGRQHEREDAPCGHWVARHRDWNVIIEHVEQDDVHVVTTEGTRKHRFGKASWVYGEELRQHTAMWWSPDSSLLAYYELDEQQVQDYYLVSGLTEWRTQLMREGYPKAGEPNPIAKLWVYHLDSKDHVAVDVGDDTEQYIYNIQWSPHGDELLFSRLNRRQDVLEIVATNPHTGQSRVVVTEQQDTWQDNWPTMQFLDDGKRFVWSTEMTNWNQLELRDLDGSYLVTLTQDDYPVASIERINEDIGVMYFTAYSDEIPLNRHLHRVNLDGTESVRLTQASLNHSVNVSPCGAWFITRSESLATMPRTTLHDARDGAVIAVLAESDMDDWQDRNWPESELFSFLAEDGTTRLYGMLHKPSNFDPDKTYPLLIDVYGGPLSQRVRNTYRPVNPACEFGFIIASIDNRGTANRGKAFKDAAYLKLGIVDIKDQADGVQHLVQRPYIDGDRVGIFGGSYGGYLAALGLMRYPDVFHAAVAAAAVTDWRHYDTIYTERFMRTPQENEANYDAGSVITYVDDMVGQLLILHGMVDDNVHPANAFHLIDALHNAGKDFELMIYPNRAHGLGVHARNLRWRFFVRHLIEMHTERSEGDARVNVSAN